MYLYCEADSHAYPGKYAFLDLDVVTHPEE